MAKRNSVPNIGDMMDLNKFEQSWHKPEEYQGISLVLKDVAKRTGARGDYYLMTVHVEELNEDVFVSTGASQPSLVISAWLQGGAQTMRFTFAKDGDRILMVNPVD